MFTRRKFVTAGACIVSSTALSGIKVYAETQKPVVAVAKGTPSDCVKRVVNALGGIKRFVKEGYRVLIKPNMGFPNPPEWSTTTHPDVVKTVAEMGTLGSYNSDHTVYTITSMFPKRPWRNFLWNERFIASIDQFGGGASWHRTGELYSGACNAGDSRLFFLRDSADKVVWAANRNFNKEPFAEFYTEVGQGFSRIVSCYKGLRFSFRIFIPLEGDVECWTIELENVSKSTRKIDLFAYADSDLNKNEHSAYNHGGFDRELGGVLLSHHAYNIPKVLLHHYLASDIAPSAYETTNLRFRGVYGRITMPDAVKAGSLSSTDTSFDQEMILALQFAMTLAPGEKRTISMVNGLAQNAVQARQMARALLQPERFAHELAAVDERARSALNKVFIQTPDDDINALTNVWLKRQIDLGKTWARTYTRGFRDIMQDTTAFTPLDPVIAADKIKYCLAYQRANGNPLRQWEPVYTHP